MIPPACSPATATHWSRCSGCHLRPRPAAPARRRCRDRAHIFVSSALAHAKRLSNASESITMADSSSSSATAAAASPFPELNVEFNGAGWGPSGENLPVQVRAAVICNHASRGHVMFGGCCILRMDTCLSHETASDGCLNAALQQAPLTARSPPHRCATISAVCQGAICRVQQVR